MGLSTEGGLFGANVAGAIAVVIRNTSKMGDRGSLAFCRAKQRNTLSSRLERNGRPNLARYRVFRIGSRPPGLGTTPERYKTAGVQVTSVKARLAWPVPSSSLPPGHQRTLAANCPIERPWDRPQLDPKVCPHGGSSLVAKWKVAEPIAAQRGGPCPRTAQPGDPESAPERGA